MKGDAENPAIIPIAELVDAQSSENLFRKPPCVLPPLLLAVDGEPLARTLLPKVFAAAGITVKYYDCHRKTSFSS